MKPAQTPQHENARAAVRVAAWREPHVIALMLCKQSGVSIPELLRWIWKDDPQLFPRGGREDQQ